MTDTFLQRFTNVRREEAGPAFVAGLFVFRSIVTPYRNAARRSVVTPGAHRSRPSNSRGRET